jgi:hypothetical protein
VYHDNESGTLVQLVFKARMNGITLDDVASNMCVRQKERERGRERENRKN